jgi:hypothetical protein
MLADRKEGARRRSEGGSPVEVGQLGADVLKILVALPPYSGQLDHMGCAKYIAIIKIQEDIPPRTNC